MRSVLLSLLLIGICLAEPKIQRVCHNPDGYCYITGHPEDDIPQEIEQGLWIGNMYAAANQQALAKLGITHIVSAIGEPDHLRHEGVQYLVLDFPDVRVRNVGNYLLQAHAFIQQARDSGGVVLVHCAAGVSRSATIAASHLMIRRELSRDQALERVKKARHVIGPNEHFMEVLKKLEAFLMLPHQDVIHLYPG